MPKVFFPKSPLAQQAILHHMSYDYPTHEVKHVVVIHTSFNSMVKNVKNQKFYSVIVFQWTSLFQSLSTWKVNLCRW